MPNALEISSLVKKYSVKVGLFSQADLYAVNSLNLSIQAGSTVSIVGESGCGKSTLAKLILGIENMTSGSILINNLKITETTFRQRALLMSMIFQDPNSSFNPRKRIQQILAEPLEIQKQHSPEVIQKKVLEMIVKVGLREEHLQRYPHMFSGGQKQRIAIARALITEPKILICDEPVSALDVSIQGQIINLLRDLQKQMGLTIIFISHDLSVVEFISDYIAVMYLGKIVEYGPTTDVFSHPRHPYTQLLIQSTPRVSQLGSAGEIPEAELPSPLYLPKGCSFQSRCPRVMTACRKDTPELRSYNQSSVACFEVKQ